MAEEELGTRAALLWHAEDVDDSFLLGKRTIDPLQPRRRRLRRSDLACLAVVSFVVSFVCISQPSIRTENPLFLHRPLPTQANPPTTRARDVADSIAPVAKGYLTYADIGTSARQHGYQVDYEEHRGFVIDGRASLMLGGSIAINQSSTAVWEQVLRKAKNDGLNYVQLDLDWRLHEPKPDEWNFAGRQANLTQLYELVSDVGLFLRIRIGPSTPLWLDTKHTQTSIMLGSQALERFVRKIVEISEPFMASQGGSIISMRIDSDLAIPDSRYWAALVQQLEPSIRWELPVEEVANNKSPTVAVLSSS